VSQGDRYGTYRLAQCWEAGIGCAMDMAKAKQLYRAAAELGDAHAQVAHGQLAFGWRDWERYHWWCSAVARGLAWTELYEAVLQLLPSFEKGELGRVLHIVAPVLMKKIEAAQRGEALSRTERKDLVKYQRVVELHCAMLVRARRAIDCWSTAGRRLGVVKDMRVVIAKMAWAEVWRWGEQEETVKNDAAKRVRGK
jgi:hypothetical protein